MGRRTSTTRWKKPKTLSERWEDWIPKTDPADKRPRNRRGREVGPSLNERIAIEEDERDQALKDAWERKQRDENLGYNNIEELRKAYESGEVTEYDINAGNVKGFWPKPKKDEDPNLTNTDDIESGVVKSDSDLDGEKELKEKAVIVEKAKTDLFSTQIAVSKQRELDRQGGQEYTTNFQEAMRHANKSQAWEDTIDSDRPLEKSNVFTKAAMDWGQYKEGDTLGVMTRRQRRAYDEFVSKAEQAKSDAVLGTIEDSVRTAEEAKAIHSEAGLETVITGEDVAEQSKSSGVSFTGEAEKDDK
tara:strand:+ start:86 stop:991 length:906 start_codon:yes stop_codon:yes gene_type:complete